MIGDKPSDETVEEAVRRATFQAHSAGENKHTPTPWKQVGARVYAGDRRVACCDHHAPHVADPVDVANAALIARTVNAHDELVRAVKACRDMLTSDKAEGLPLLQWCEDAIAKAEGRS